jgi:pantoate--beta-alanine ligase
MYAPGDATRVEVSGISEPLCGSHRPGHFRGVTTIVARLLVSVGPEFAVFGQKDAQQCLVLERMVRDLGFPTRLIICSTIREADGLALSSRNRYLSADDRKQALALSAALRAGRAALAAGERDVTSVEATMKASSGEIDLDYAQLLSLPDLSEKMRAEGHMLLAIAGRIGRARLIDNLCVRIEADSVLDAPLLPAATLQSILKAQEE